MAEYAPKPFFKKTPNQLLIRYFASKNLLTEHDFSELPENKPDEILEAWKQLDENARIDTETDFTTIYKFSCEAGIKAFLEAAKPNEKQLIEKFAELESFQAKAFTVFLDHPELLKKAVVFFSVNQVANSRWFDCKISNPLPAKVDDESIKALSSSLSCFFFDKYSKGNRNNCEVDVYERGNLLYVVALPEDYANSFLRWNGPVLDSSPLRPAFQIIFVYCREKAKISLHMKGVKQTKEQVRKLFIENLIDKNLKVLKEDEKTFSLDQLTQESFDFSFSPQLGIQDVTINKMRYTVIGGKNSNHRITIETNPDNPTETIHSLRDKILSPFAASQLKLNQVGIVVTFETLPNHNKPKTKTFEITLPNSCSLRLEGKEGIIRKMLAESGIELA